MSARCTEVLHDLQRLLFDVVARLPRPPHSSRRRLLDVGCWDGTTTLRYAELLDADAHGVEVFPEQAARARARGVEVAEQDLETTPFPWGDGSMDVVVANQVLEHLKNPWLPMSEIFRVLEVGGRAVLSVPNLGSLHNRLLLALGRQPTTIRTFGPHVRGFTWGEFRRFVEYGDGFVVERTAAAGFYPLPIALARIACRLWPAAGVTTVMVARKSRDIAPPWASYLRDQIDQGLQTWIPLDGPRPSGEDARRRLS